MRNIFFGWLLAGTLVFQLSGCCSCNRADWPDSPSLAHMDLSQKLIYMDNVKRTLMVFRTSLADIEQHAPELPPEEQPLCEDQSFPCEVFKYVEVYAMPIITDDGALANLQTRLDVAKINLLSAFALYETGQYGKARSLVRLFEKQYGEDPSVLNAFVESGELEFSTLGEGLRSLKWKLTIG
jgi:hypothetical protein